MADSRLVIYVNSEIQKGVPLEEIKRTLLNEGWPKKEIKKAFSAESGDSFNKKKYSKKLVIYVLISFFIILGVGLLILLITGREKCVETWNCGEWSVCINNERSRDCVDLNKCGTFKNKPVVTEECFVVINNVDDYFSPKDLFVEYMKEFDRASNIDSLLSSIKKYISKELIFEIEKLEKEIEGSQEEIKQFILSEIKKERPKYSQIIDILEDIKEDSVTLNIKTVTNVEGIVELKKEGVGWKISDEIWIKE